MATTKGLWVGHVTCTNNSCSSGATHDVSVLALVPLVPFVPLVTFILVIFNVTVVVCVLEKLASSAKAGKLSCDVRRHSGGCETERGIRK